MRKFVIQSLLLIFIVTDVHASRLVDLKSELMKNEDQKWSISELDHILKLYKAATVEVNKNPSRDNMAELLKETVAISKYDKSDYLSDTMFPVYKKHKKVFKSVLKTLDQKDQATIKNFIYIAQKTASHGNG